MSSGNMVPETVNPQALQLQRTDLDAADGWVDIPITAIGLEDFDTTSLGSVDGAKTKSGLMESETVDFVNSGSTIDWPFDLECMIAGRIDTGSLQLATMDFDASYNYMTPGFTEASVSCGKANVRSTDDIIAGMGVLEYPIVNVTPVHYHPMGLDNANFNFGMRVAAMAGGQQLNLTGPFSQPPAPPQLANTANLGSPQHAKSTHLVSQVLPKQTRLGGSAKGEPITSDDWEGHRPFIEQLYIIENVKLTDVMKILKAKFGFEATEKMYKTKITQWGLKKNYTAAEKEHLAYVFKRHRDSGKGNPPLTLRNRPAKLDRIRRFCRQEKILEEICDALQSDSPFKENINSSAKALAGNRGAATAQVIRAVANGVQNSSSSSAQCLKQALFDPERPFSTTSNIGRIELILLQTKIYQQSNFGSGTRPNTRGAPIQDYEESIYLASRWTQNMIVGVIALAQHKSARGWRMINEACEVAHKILGQQPRNLFRVLFYGFGHGGWAVFPGLRTYILRFFTKSSVGKLGCNHPISVVLYHLQEQQIFADATSPVFEVLMDAFGEYPGPTNDEFWATISDYCDVLSGQGEYAAAESHAQRFLKQSEEVIGRLHWRTRGLLFNLAETHYEGGRYDLAEIECQDVLQRHREASGNGPDAACISALLQLAQIYEVRGDFARSEEYWRAVLAGTIKRWGMEDEWTTYVIIQLEQSFKNQSMDPEAWLQQNFGISCI